jgi:hypothetical protein
MYRKIRKQETVDLRKSTYMANLRRASLGEPEAIRGAGGGMIGGIVDNFAKKHHLIK